MDYKDRSEYKDMYNEYNAITHAALDELKDVSDGIDALIDRTEMMFYQNKPLSLDMGYQKN